MARVDFTLEEWQRFYGGWIGRGEQEDADALEIYEGMRDARRGREANEVMEVAAEFLGEPDPQALFARDGRIVTDPWDAMHLIEYVNAGDTYTETLIYDGEQHAFYLGSYGGFIEAWEAENQQECIDCGVSFPPGYLDESGLCSECVKPAISTWRAERWGNPPLIAMLRSIEGDELAVHFWDDKPEGVAFSVPLADGTFSAQQIKGRTSDEPYVYVWPDLVAEFRRGPEVTKSVAFTDRDVTIEQSEFQKLRVAMDSFIDGGHVQRNPFFLEAGPPLWTCSELYCHWYEERGEATVEAFADRVHGPAQWHKPSRYNTEVLVWSARSPEVEQLIEDDFIKWGDDASVRAYLRDQGVCRKT